MFQAGPLGVALAQTPGPWVPGPWPLTSGGAVGSHFVKAPQGGLQEEAGPPRSLGRDPAVWRVSEPAMDTLHSDPQDTGTQT